MYMRNGYHILLWKKTHPSLGDNQEHYPEVVLSEQILECFLVVWEKEETGCQQVLLFLFLFFLNFLMFIFERHRETGMSRGEREGDTETEAGSRLRAVSTEPDMGLEPTNCEIMT